MMVMIYIGLYLVIAGMAMGIAERIFDSKINDDPSPFFAGLFWPVTGIVWFPIAATRYCLKRHDDWAEKKKRNEADMRRRIEELEHELRLNP